MDVIKPVEWLDSCLVSSNALSDYDAEDAIGQTPHTYTPWATSTGYTVGTRVLHRRSATDTLDTTRRYECLINHTSGTTSADYPCNNLTGATPKWLDLGASNKFAFVDDKWGTQTYAQNTDATGTITVTSSNTIVTVTGSSILTLEVSIPSGMRIDSLAALNIWGRYIRVRSDLGGGSIFDKTLLLENNIGVFDWEDYFYAEIVSERDAIFSSIPPGPQTLTIEIYGNADQVLALGGLSLGRRITIGKLQASPKVSIVDYSVKTTDAFGNISVTQRAYSKKFSGQLFLNNEDVDSVASILASLRASPCVWIGAGNDYSSLIVWGFYKDFEIDIAYPIASYCSITIEGLI